MRVNAGSYLGDLLKLVAKLGGQGKCQTPLALARSSWATSEHHGVCDAALLPCISDILTLSGPYPALFRTPKKTTVARFPLRLQSAWNWPEASAQTSTSCRKLGGLLDVPGRGSARANVQN